MSFCALSEANKELTPNHAMNTMEISDRDTPMARCAPLRNPFVMLVWMREKKAGPTIKESVRPNSIPCVMTLKLTIWKPLHNKNDCKGSNKTVIRSFFYGKSSMQGINRQWQEPFFLLRSNKNVSWCLCKRIYEGCVWKLCEVVFIYNPPLWFLFFYPPWLLLCIYCGVSPQGFPDFHCDFPICLLPNVLFLF